MTPSSALALAVDKVGGQSAMGRLIGTSQASVWRWLDQGRPLPAEHVLRVEAATGVSRHDLRPDIYPCEPSVPGSEQPGASVDPLSAGGRPAGDGAPLAHARALPVQAGHGTCDRSATSHREALA